MKITKNDIPHIQKALGLKLYEHQVNYLLDEEEAPKEIETGIETEMALGLPKEMQAGSESEKRLAYSIKLLLSEGKTLNLNKTEQFADKWSLKEDERLFYAKKIFRKEFISIWCKLHDYRVFPVRNVFI